MRGLLHQKPHMLRPRGHLSVSGSDDARGAGIFVPSALTAWHLYASAHPPSGCEVAVKEAQEKTRKKESVTGGQALGSMQQGTGGCCLGLGQASGAACSRAHPPGLLPHCIDGSLNGCIRLVAFPTCKPRQAP